MLPCPPPAGTRRQIHLTSATVTHLGVTGRVFNGTGKSNEHPKAQAGIAHLGAGSVLGSQGLSALAQVSVQVHDTPWLFQRE